MCREAHTVAIALSFGMPGDIVDAITHAKFYVNLFGGFGVLIPPILPFSIIGLASRPYDCRVSTTMLHCDCHLKSDEERIRYLSSRDKQLLW